MSVFPYLYLDFVCLFCALSVRKLLLASGQLMMKRHTLYERGTRSEAEKKRQKGKKKTRKKEEDSKETDMNEEGRKEGSGLPSHSHFISCSDMSLERTTRFALLLPSLVSLGLMMMMRRRRRRKRRRRMLQRLPFPLLCSLPFVSNLVLAA